MYDNRSASAARPHGARRRRVLSLVAGCALALTTGAVVWGSTTSAAAPSEKIRICHATNAEDNPYRSIEVDKAGGANGHIDHIGPVFQPGMKDDGIVWGDIIPEFTFEGETFSLNWTEEGIAIWEHGCAVPATVDVCPNIPGDQTEPRRAWSSTRRPVSASTTRGRRGMCAPTSPVSRPSRRRAW